MPGLTKISYSKRFLRDPVHLLRQHMRPGFFYIYMYKTEIMNLYVVNITVPAKNKKYYERVSLNLYPMVFKIEEEIGEAFKRPDVITCIKEVVKSKKLYDAAEIYIRDLTNINNIEEQIISLQKLVSIDLMEFAVD